MKKTIFMAACAVALFASCGHEKGAPKPSFEDENDTVSYQLGMVMSPDLEELKSNLASPMVGSDSIYVDEYLQGVKDAIAGADDKKKVAYMAGMQQGLRMAQNLQAGEKQIFADSTETFSRKNFIAGFVAGLNGKRTALEINGKPMDKEDARRDMDVRLQRMAEKALEKKYGENKKKGEAYMAKKGKEAGIQKLQGGTLYKVITAGTGEHVKDGDMVNIVYEGRLTNDSVFDASSNSGERSIPMRVGASIPGFDAALRAMTVGSEWEIYIPADQAYGGNPNIPQIPPFSVLIFKVKMEGLYNPENSAQ